MANNCTVITMIRENLNNTLSFAAWYLQLGAAKIVMFFDDPKDAAIARLQHIDRIECIPCTPEFWKSINTVPAHVMRKQKAVFSWCYRRATTPWVLALDGDEFLYLNDRSLDEYIAALPDGTVSVRFQPVEPVTTETGSWFRTVTRKDTLAEVYGEDARFFLPRSGLLGHNDGKSMTRAGHAARWRLHWAETVDGRAINDKFSGPSDGTFLVHYFDAGYLKWRRKLDWRKAAWGFSKRVSGYLNQFTEGELEGLYNRLHSLNDAQLAKLQSIGGVLQLDVDRDKVRRQTFNI